MVRLKKDALLGWQDDWVGKGACCQGWQPEFIRRTQMVEGENRLSLDLHTYAVTISKCEKVKRRCLTEWTAELDIATPQREALKTMQQRMCLRASRMLSRLWCHLPCYIGMPSLLYFIQVLVELGCFGVFCFAVLGLEHSSAPLNYILSSFVYSSVYFLEIVWVVQTSLEHSIAQEIFKFLILLPHPPKITACAIGPGILLLFYFVKDFLNCMGILPEYMTVHHMHSSYQWWPEEGMGSSDLKL